MGDTASVSQDTLEQVEGRGGADLVIGFVKSPKDQQAISHAAATTRAAVQSLAHPVRAVLVHSGGAVESSSASDPVQIVTMPGSAVDPASPIPRYIDGFLAVTNVARTLSARACAIVGSDPASIDEGWIVRLAGPVLEGGFDLVTPCYARHRFEGLINRAIVYPLLRALYGRRVLNPLGPDLCLSAQLAQRVPAGAAARIHPVACLLPEAVSNGMAICQSHLGVWSFPVPEDTGVSALLAQVLGPLFSEIERRAAFLQRVRMTQPVEEFGTPVDLPDTEASPDATRLIESFQIGTKNLQEIWSMVLPPSTIVELKHLAAAAAANFHLHDEIWARIVYDFALAYRLRSINRDHLLRAITPLYLGWVASYALDPENTSAEGAEHIVERLCVAYETARSYFVARWRWPDRFNP